MYHQNGSSPQYIFLWRTNIRQEIPAVDAHYCCMLDVVGMEFSASVGLFLLLCY